LVSLAARHVPVAVGVTVAALPWVALSASELMSRLTFRYVFPGLAAMVTAPLVGDLLIALDRAGVT